MTRSEPHIEVGETKDGLWIAGAAGRGRITLVGSSVVRIDVEGHAYAEFAEVMTAFMNEAARERSRIYLGIDAEGMASYDARFRYLWTEWIKANRDILDGILILFRSRVVQSVAVIINAVTGADLVEAWDDREAFEDRLAEALIN